MYTGTCQCAMLRNVYSMHFHAAGVTINIGTVVGSIIAGEWLAMCHTGVRAGTSHMCSTTVKAITPLFLQVLC